MAGRIFLIPTQMGDGDINNVIPLYNQEVIQGISYFIVENERTARRQLIKMGIKTPIDDLTFFLLNKHTNASELDSFLEPLKENDIGIMSEAGLPGIADPGSEIVQRAQNKGYKVVPLVGPSSIFMALMASGFNGQQFRFHGYLPVKPQPRKQKIKELERSIRQNSESQLFIEAPYRNNQMLEEILQSCNPETKLCIASMISTPDEFIITKTVKGWKQKKPDLHKLPTVFILGA